MNTVHTLSRLINLLLGLVTVSLLLRLVLKLFGANPRADFVTWVYQTTDPLLEPFRNMFPSPIMEPGHILEFSTLFAILAYGILAWLLVELLELVAEARTRRQLQKDAEQENNRN